MPDTREHDERAAKRELRGRLSAARSAIGPAEQAAAALALAEHLLCRDELGGARTVACYVSTGSEPGTGPLLDRLREADARVLLPVLLGDNDLDWAEHDGALTRGRHGLWEPEGHRLGAHAIASADVVVVPALAVDRRGRRLGRGGGSYDRALARISPLAWTVTPLYRGEVLDRVPAEPHDLRVHAAVTPDGTHRFTGAAIDPECDTP